MGAPAVALLGRSAERSHLDEELRRVRGGASAVVVLQGEAGIGKTTLINYLIAQASGCRIGQVAGVESEIELPFAALHQLLAPLLDGVDALPAPQQQALQVALGQALGRQPDRFLLGLAVLGLLAEAAVGRPLVCLVDDAQWLDEATGQVLGFLARRLLAESVLLVLAIRAPAPAQLLRGLPVLTISGLADADAQALLAAANPGRLDAKVRDRIVAETRGNPLALLELSRTGKAELLGGFAVPAVGTTSDLEDRYVQRICTLPEPTRLLLLTAAADPTGDAALLRRAAQHLGLGLDAAAAAGGDADLVEIVAQVRFRHPLIRSAAYAAATAEERRRIHAALAAALDGSSESRVWHLAAATIEPDAELADTLVGAARTAEQRGAAAAAAALLQRSATLTAEPRLRAERTLAATQAHLDAGAFETAWRLLPIAEADAVDDLQHARVDLIRGRIERAAHSGRQAPAMLLRAAHRLEPLDPLLARHTYLDAWSAALVAGELAVPGGELRAVSEAACQTPGAVRPGPADHLLVGLATMITSGTRAAEPSLRAAVTDYLAGDMPVDDRLHGGVLVADAALALWDYDAWETVSTRHIELARASGALAPLANALNAGRVIALWRGDVELARSLGVEEQTVKEVTGIQRASYGDLFLLAYQGHAAQSGPLIAAAATEATERGEGLGVQMTDRASALLHLGLGHYAEAQVAAARAATGDLGPFTGQALPDLIESAARNGEHETAAHAVDRLAVYTAVSRSDWAAAMLARSRAMISEAADAENGYTEAVERLSRTRLRFELARSRLLYGEWLRRERRRADSRAQLKAAFDEFTGMAADGFAERARHELLATGEKVRKRTADTVNELTPQEELIARMARAGRTNPEIGAELYISARTVEWHLRKVFEKLGIASRRELRDVLPARRADRRLAQVRRQT